MAAHAGLVVPCENIRNEQGVGLDQNGFLCKSKAWEASDVHDFSASRLRLRSAVVVKGPQSSISAAQVDGVCVDCPGDCACLVC